MSKILTLNFKDLAKGLLMAFMGAVLGALYQILTTTGVLPSTGASWWTMILLPGITAFLGYLLKNFLSGNNPVSQSAFLTINWLDFFKGLLTATCAALFGAIYSMFTTGMCSDWNCWWSKILLPASIAFVGYIIKNLFTNSDGDTFSAETVTK